MNVLLSSVGRRSYLVHYFREALPPGGRVICTNCEPDTPGMFFADIARTLPVSYDPRFLEELHSVCDQYRPKLLFSLHDMEIHHIVRHKAQLLQKGTIPVVPSPEFAELCLDKFATHQFAQSHEIASPKTLLHIPDAMQALNEGQVAWPLVVKPRFGFGSLGIQSVYNAEGLTAACAAILHEISRHNYLRGGQELSDSVVIQEHLRGEEYGLDIVCDLAGNFVTCLIEKKLRMRSGETDAAEIVEDAVLFDLGRRIGQIARTPGVLDVDVIVKADIPYLLDMNPRFGGHYPFAHVAGANIPAALIAWAQGHEPDPAWFRAHVGVRGFKDIAIVRGQ